VRSYEDFTIGLLLEDGSIVQDDVARARQRLTERGESGERLAGLSDALVAIGAISERAVSLARATVCESPWVDLDHYEVDFHNAALLPRSLADACQAFPIFRLGDSVTVAMSDPLDLRAVDRIRSAIRGDVEPVLADASALAALIGRAYSMTSASGPRASSRDADAAAAADRRAGEEPIVAAVNQIIAQGIDEGASDIHIGPDEHELHLRYRIDGSLHPRQGPGRPSHAGLVQRIKVMANLDLTQSRRPQDGKFRFTHGPRTIDVRVSLIPTVWGENVVLRLLAGGTHLGSFESLGFSPDQTTEWERLVRQPHGIILVTGPTGSGKTTTLYTALKQINSPDANLVTIEDPVEIRLPMVRHVQINTEIGMTFASALRAILRQDPDVILVGEIRDEETARISIQAALTGHLVLSTLHTNDAPGAVARMREFGCPPFAINSALLSVVAQRLVKKVCAECATPAQPDPALIRRFTGSADAGGQFRRGRGCPRCGNAGTRGRIGIFEMLRMDPIIQDAVDRGLSGSALRRIALDGGMVPIWKRGFEMAQTGIVALEDIVRIAAGTIDADQRRAAPAPELPRLTA
jgi:type IV pilus assembly protein PilB